MATQEIDFTMNFEEAQQSDADKRLLVTFFREAVQSEFKSIEAGRPIFDDIDMIRIMTPGSRDTTVGIAHYGYQQRFPRQWTQYKQNAEQTGSGTPLSAVPWLTNARVAELAVFHIRTVEQLANMPDNAAQRFMDHHALKQQAAAFLEAAKGAAPMLKLQAELSARDEQIAELRAAVSAMQASIQSANQAKVAAKG